MKLSTDCAVLFAATVAAANLAAAPALAADTPAKVVHRAPESAYAAALAAHPQLAQMSGDAAARCKVSAAGAVTGCVLLREYPVNSGFGQALLGAAAQFQVQPATRDGRPVDSDVVLEIAPFKIDKKAEWLHKPTPGELLGVWPRDALRKGIPGQATVNCLVSPQGALFECVVQSETPAGLDYGRAALALTPQLLMKPAELRGQPVVSQATIPIVFKTEAPLDIGPQTRGTASAAMIWSAAPSYAEVAAAYPAKARARRLAGHATLYCDFTNDGRLTHCQTLVEEPRGEGFAAAARKLAERFHAYPATPDGKGLGNVAVQVPVAFDPAMLDAANQVIGRPQWAALPSAEDVHAAFGATPRGIGTVRVVLGCVVQQGGWIGECTVGSETPPGMGLGPAALALAAKVRVVTWTSEGLPVVGARLNVPIRYESGAPEPAPAKAP